MGTTCLTVCPECNRHLRCGERACPFCGARVSSFLRVLEYRLKTRLSRGQGLSLGAALTAVGIASIGNDISCIAAYGGPCVRADTCEPSGGVAGQGGLTPHAGANGLAGMTGAGGILGGFGTAGSAQGGNAGGAGGNAQGGVSGTAQGGTAGTTTQAGGAGGEAMGGEGGAGGAPSDPNGGNGGRP
ncbi:MAG: hypothetical protein ABUL60_22510 [Myxococcales bacterium]